MTGNPSNVRVVVAGGIRKVVAFRPLLPGELILTIEGREVDRPDRYTVQVGDGVHITPGDDVDAHPERYPWRFLNHHCRPNARVRGRELVALRSIAPGDEITFDYNTTELEMACPFECWCDAVEGRHEIRGFKYLSPAERERLAPHLAAHLRPYLRE